MTGLQKIDKQTLYFDQDGKQVKGKIVTLSDKSIRYFDANSGEMATDKFVEGSPNEWYYLIKLKSSDRLAAGWSTDSLFHARRQASQRKSC